MSNHLVRCLLVGIALILGIAAPAVAQDRSYPNGYWKAETQTFVWSNIGGDPLRISHRQALMQERVLKGVPVRVVEALLVRLEEARKGPPNHTISQHDRTDFMISGDGWIARNALADVGKWKPHMSRRAWLVYYTDPDTKVQWRLINPEGCNNLLLDKTEGPILCPCIPIKDACPSKR